MTIDLTILDLTDGPAALDQHLTGWGSWAELQSSVKALTFGRMCDLAHDTLVQFRSDLFHDALFINELLDALETDEIVSFVWSFDRSGTGIRLAKWANLSGLDRSNVWTIDVYSDDRSGKDQRAFRIRILRGVA